MSDRFEISKSIIDSFNDCINQNQPYEHWLFSNVLPKDTVDDIINLPFKPQDVGDNSGRREIHNDTRNYFGPHNKLAFDVVKEVANAFQLWDTIDIIQEVTRQKFDGKFLRIEYTQDTGNFWLEPHTDIGVKKFTMLIYLSKEASHFTLGTDLYEEFATDSDDNMGYKHVGQAPFESNNAVMFIPGDDTFHGFEPKYIDGVRKALIINYVDPEWRERNQLCFPNAPIGQ